MASSEERSPDFRWPRAPVTTQRSPGKGPAHPAARLAVDAIIDDMCGRAGIGEMWGSIDSDIQDEIKSKWAELIGGYIS